MDLQVAFTATDVVPNVAQTLRSAGRLARRLRIGQTVTRFERTAIDFWHGFVPLPEAHRNGANANQLEGLGFRELRGQWYRTEDGPFERNPYYQYRLGLLERDLKGVPLNLEADGICLAVHEQMFTIHLRLIQLHPEDGKTIVGPFVGDLFETSDSWMPFHELEERTTVGGPLAHIRLVEFLAALKREAIPSLTIRDPSGYLEHGSVPALLETMDIAAAEFASLAQTLSPDEEIPTIFERQSAVPTLNGPVGGKERVAQLEGFLDSHGFVAPDIHEMLERGR
jgi:hypothetical protein